MASRFCVTCGAELKQDVAFCTTCGAPIEDARGKGIDTSVGSTIAPVPNQAPVPQRPSSSKSSTGLIVAICAATAVVIIALLVIFLVIPNVTKPAASSKSSASSTATSPASSSSSTQRPPSFSTIEVSSQLPSDKDSPDYGAINLTDNNSETAWNEGSASDGTGEWIRCVAPDPQHVTSVSIMGGFPRIYKDGSDVYFKNNRPQRITISYEGGSESFVMQDLRGQFQTFTLAKPVNTTFINITIDSVYKGTKYNECCIAELKIQ